MSLCSVSTWDIIFERGGRVDWYFSADICISFIESIIQHFNFNYIRILHTGCGSSELSELLGKIPRVIFSINADFSENAFTTFDYNFEFAVMDAKYLPFVSGSFDLIVEKGLFDSITSRKLGAIENARKLLTEYSRVLSTKGFIVIFSTFGPHADDEDGKDMLNLLSHEKFSVMCNTLPISPFEIPDQLFCFAYVLNIIA